MTENTVYASSGSITGKSVVSGGTGECSVHTDLFRAHPCEEIPVDHIRISGLDALKSLHVMFGEAIKHYERTEEEQKGKGLPF